MSAAYGKPVMRGSVFLSYNPHEAPPTEVPLELRTFYNKEVWNARLSAVVRRASRCYKYKFELAWFLIFLAAMIAVPIAMFYVALKVLPMTKRDKDWAKAHPVGYVIGYGHYYNYWWHDIDRVWQARLVGFGSWVAIVLLYTMPLVIWKCTGRNKVNQMLKSWGNEDRAASSASDVEVPTWRLKYIGIFSTTIKLVIHYPITEQTSSFHPATYLPTYIVNGPSSPGIYYETRYVQGQVVAPSVMLSATFPPQGLQGDGGGSAVGPLSAVPLYDDNDRTAPPYRSRPPSENSLRP
ncbi:hypothetical protein ABKN59_010050 [Abortiporus biennis]